MIQEIINLFNNIPVWSVFILGCVFSSVIYMILFSILYFTDDKDGWGE